MPTSNVFHGSVPQMNRYPEGLGQKPLFHSVRDIALILDKSVKAGYGVLPIGTVMAVNTNDSKLVPYPMSTAASNENNAKAYLVADGVDTEAIVYTTVPDSYKFEVGDSLIIDADGQTPQDLGAITAIDRTDASGTRAKITATIAISGSAMTMASSANVYLKSASADPFAEAKYILDKDIDTGEGENAEGAITSVVVNNAILYETTLVGYDDAAATDLGTTEDGRFVILK